MTEGKSVWIKTAAKKMLNVPAAGGNLSIRIRAPSLVNPPALQPDVSQAS